jgi:YesN/AraC family two-component response regulator
VQSAAVHPVHIDKISELYARKIEGVVFEKELLDISNEMIRKYCLLVHNYSLKGYSEVVCDALNYIDCHLNDSISLKKMAEHIKVNSSYLSVRFKKEVGQSVIDYVNQKKVENSLLYLAATDMSMVEVAERVGIDDANYFSKLFKKYRGMTPRQYHMLMYSKN